MTTYGLTTTGFVRKTTQDILDELEASEKALISPSLNVSAETPIGQFNGIMAAKLAELWELAEAVNSNQSPDLATGFGLDGVAGITGTFRAAATKGTVDLTVNLNAGTTLPAGSIAEVSGDPTNRWVTLAAVTNGGGSPANFVVAAEAENAGAIVANAGTITVISTPVAGWNSVTNALDAVPGTDIDTDAELRSRRELELAVGGKATFDAIIADLLVVTDVVAVTLLMNRTWVTDGNGLPPHSVEAIVRGGTNQNVGNALWATVGAGIYTHGDTPVAVVDSQGNNQSVRISRPTEVLIYLEIDVDVDATEYPAGGDALIAAAVVAFGDAEYVIGGDVILSKLNVPVDSVPGIVDITEIRVGITASPTSTVNYPIDTRELAVLDTARILVTSTPV